MINLSPQSKLDRTGLTDRPTNRIIEAPLKMCNNFAIDCSVAFFFTNYADGLIHVNANTEFVPLSDVGKRKVSP